MSRRDRISTGAEALPTAPPRQTGSLDAAARHHASRLVDEIRIIFVVEIAEIQLTIAERVDEALRGEARAPASVVSHHQPTRQLAKSELLESYERSILLTPAELQLVVIDRGQ